MAKNFDDIKYKYLKVEARQLLLTLQEDELIKLLANFPLATERAKERKESDPDIEQLKSNLRKAKEELKLAQEQYDEELKKLEEIYDFSTRVLLSRGVVIKTYDLNSNLTECKI